MDINHATSVSAIVEELGARLKRARLNQNITQQALAKRAGVTRKRVIQAESGGVDLLTFIALLKALGMIDQIDNFLPPVPFSPIQLAKLAGKTRQRASGSGDDDPFQKGADAW